MDDDMPEYGFYFDKQRCIGCRACEVACQVWNVSTQTVKWRVVTTVIKGVYPDITGVNVTLTCMHCTDAPCIKVCPRQALSRKKDSGAVVVDQKRCMGCTFCLWVCPYGAPRLGITGKIEKCNFCEDRPLGMKRACEEICPTQAIISGPKNEIGRAAKAHIAENLLGFLKEFSVFGLK